MLLVLAALLIGLSLGIFSSGGSILTVPVLVYLAGQDPKIAIASSLMVVGSISLISTILNIRNLTISWHHVLLFGLPSMAGMVLGAFFANFVGGTIQLLAFGLVMLLAVKTMWKPKYDHDRPHTKRSNILVVFDGGVVGIVTGFVGVGGGFLIVPALVLMAGLPFTKAAATGLIIISLNSFAGFAKYQSVLETHSLSLDWNLLTIVIVCGVIGSVCGQKFARKLPQQQLRKGFSVFLLIMAIFIIYESLFKIFG